MNFAPNNLYHIYNQGNNKQPIFLSNEDYLTFLRMTRKLISHQTAIIAYCLMPNHFHFLIYTDERAGIVVQQGGLLIDPITNAFRKLLSGYARIFNKRYNRTGSLFRQKTKVKCLSEIDIALAPAYTLQDYYSNCFHYIHQNPYNAGLVNKLKDWEFSSYNDYAQLRDGTLCNKKLAETFCSYEPVNFIKTFYEIISDTFTNQFFKK
jgi:REP element-mobilizing transposase RayT